MTSADFTVNLSGRDDGLTATAGKGSKALKSFAASATGAREDLAELGKTLGTVLTSAGKMDVLSELNTQLMSLSDNIIEFGGSAADVSNTMLMIGQRAAKTGESVSLLALASRTLVDEADNGQAALMRLGTAMDVATAAGLKTEDAGRLVGRAMRGEADALKALGGPAARASDAIAKVADANERARLTMLALDRQIQNGLGPLDKMRDGYAKVNARLAVMTGMSDPLGDLGQALGITAAGAGSLGSAFAKMGVGTIKAGISALAGAVTGAAVAFAALGAAVAGVAIKALKAFAATSAGATAASERLARAQDQVWVSMGRAMVGANEATGVLEQLTATTYRLDAAVTRNSDSIRSAFEGGVTAAAWAAEAAIVAIEVALLSVVGPVDLARAAFYSLEGLLYRHIRAFGRMQEAMAPAGSEMERLGRSVQDQANEMLSALGPFESYTSKIIETEQGLRDLVGETRNAMLATDGATASNIVAINVLEKLAAAADKAAMAQSGVAATNPAADQNKAALAAAKKAKAWRPKGGGGKGRKPATTAGRIGAGAGAASGSRGGSFSGQQSAIFAGSIASVRAELDALAEADAQAAALAEHGGYLAMAGDLSLQLGDALPKINANMIEMEQQLQVGAWQRYGEAASSAILTVVDSTYQLLDAMAMGNLALKDLGVAAADMGGDLLANLGLDMISSAVGLFAVKIGAVFEGLGAAFSALGSNPIALLGIGAGVVAAGLLLKKFAGSGAGGASAAGARRADTSAANAVTALGRRLFEGEDRSDRQVSLYIDDYEPLRGLITDASQDDMRRRRRGTAGAFT